MTAKSKTGAEPMERSGSGGANGASGAIVFLTGLVISGFLFWTNALWQSYEVYKIVNMMLCLWVPLMLILFVLKQDPTQFGMARGDRRLGLKWSLICWVVMVLVLAVISRRPDFQHQYLYGGLLQQPMLEFGPVFDGIHANPRALLYYEMVMGFYMFCWEFFFRGFLLFGMQKTRLGTWGAVIVQALLFTLLHWSWRHGASKPLLEVLSALPGGIILGILALRTRSFIYGFLIHWAVSVTLDVMLLAPFFSFTFRHFG